MTEDSKPEPKHNSEDEVIDLSKLKQKVKGLFSKQKTEETKSHQHHTSSHQSKEAISRYGNLKAAHPDVAIQAIAVIAQAAGQIKEKISDEQFKNILKQMQKPKKEFKILRR